MSAATTAAHTVKADQGTRESLNMDMLEVTIAQWNTRASSLFS